MLKVYKNFEMKFEREKKERWRRHQLRMMDERKVQVAAAGKANSTGTDNEIGPSSRSHTAVFAHALRRPLVSGRQQ